MVAILFPFMRGRVLMRYLDYLYSSFERMELRLIGSIVFLLICFPFSWIQRMRSFWRSSLFCIACEWCQMFDRFSVYTIFASSGVIYLSQPLSPLLPPPSLDSASDADSSFLVSWIYIYIYVEDGQVTQTSYVCIITLGKITFTESPSATKHYFPTTRFVITSKIAFKKEKKRRQTYTYTILQNDLFFFQCLGILDSSVPMLLCSYTPLFLCFYAPMFLCSYAPMFLCSYVPLFLCSYAPLFLCSYAPLFLCSYVPMFLCSYVPMFLCYSVPLFLCSYVPMFFFCHCLK